MKKLLLTAAVGLGLGGGAWKYQNPEGTLDDLRSQTGATVSRLKSGVDAVRNSIPQEQQEQVASLESKREAQAQAVDDRLEKLESFVLSPNDGESEPDITALTNATDELREDTGSKLASTGAKIEENAEKVAEVETKISEAAAKITKTESAVSSSLEQQDQLLSSVEALQETVASLQDSVQAMNTNSESELAKIDAVDARIDLLIRRMDEQTFDSDIASLKEGLQTLGSDVIDVQTSQSQQNSTVVSDIASINERSASLNNRLDTLAALATQGGNAGESTQATASTSDSAPALASLSAGIDERFGALEERLQTVNADSRLIVNLGDQIAALRDDLTNIKQQNESNGRALQSATAEITNLKTASESLSIEAVQAEIRSQLSTVQSKLESSKESDNSSELEALVNTTRNRIRTLEQRVQELPAASAEADNAQQIQSALESQISALERRLEGINNTNPELANTLSNMQEQVEQLTSQSFLTKEDLQSESEGRTVEYKIYFNSNSSSVTDSAEEVLNSFIEQEKNRTLGVSIFGFTDRSGSANYNQQLALRRATNVRSYLIQNGMDYTKIKALTGLGEDAAARVLPDDAKDSQQRVVVLYAEQP